MTIAAFRSSRMLHARLCMMSTFLLVSCAQTLPAPVQMAQTEARSGSTEVRVGDSARVSGRITPITGSAVALIRQEGSGNVIASPQIPNYAGDLGEISLNYVDADIREIARLILGETLMLNYTIDPELMGAVTIQTARPLVRDALLPTLQGLLDQVGGTMTFQNGIFRIGLAGDERVVPPVVAGGGVLAGSQIVPLRFASARQLATLLEPYVGDAARLLVDPARNVLIVTGSPSARQNVINLIQIFDVDYLAGQSYALFPAKFGRSEQDRPGTWSSASTRRWSACRRDQDRRDQRSKRHHGDRTATDLSRSRRPADRPARPGEGDGRPKHPRLLSEECASRRSSTDPAARGEPAKRAERLERSPQAISRRPRLRRC